jgi:alanyl-tRNA synthetase
MTSAEFIAKYRRFFEERGHAYFPSYPLVPENDPTALFISAGMQPLTPYLMGEPHPLGKRLVGYQKCLRTVDIEEVGDAFHLTFFEMLGNWSLGDYWKADAIGFTWEFVAGPQWLALEPERLYATVYEGDNLVPRDDESVEAWKTVFGSVGITADVAAPSEGIGENRRIFTYGRAENWWGPVGETGPCGPDSEMFYDTLALGAVPDHHPEPSTLNPLPSKCHPNCGCGRFVEVGNDVFMQFQKTAEGAVEPLAQQNVDNGRGLERFVMILQGKPSVYETDLFAPIMARIAELAQTENETSARIIADHLRASTFLIGDGVIPSNKDQGYVLRRLIRRAVRHGRTLSITENFTAKIAEVVVEHYADRYPELAERRGTILEELEREEQKFRRTLEQGLKIFQKQFIRWEIDEKGELAHDVQKKRSGELKTEFHEVMSGKKLFELYETYGFPLELSQEIARENGIEIRERQIKEFYDALERHRALSRAGAEQKFAGGLSDHTEATTRLHTATHLLLESLRRVLGDHVSQRGSNITAERLRFDFNHPEALTPEQLKQVEDLVNEQIRADLPVSFSEMSLDEAKQTGATGVFEHKYGERVKVYTIGDFSKEICGGPHVERTGDLGTFKIKKEESVGAGLRRIRAVLE